MQEPIAHVVGQSGADPLALLDRGGTVVVRAPEGEVGPEAAATLGALAVAGLWDRARRRRPWVRGEVDIAVILDEFPVYVDGVPLAPMLDRARKRGIGLVLAHQRFGQIKNRDTLDAVKANARTRIALAVGRDDAAILAPDFGVRIDELVRPPAGKALCLPTIGGKPGPPFAFSLPRRPHSSAGRRREVLRASRLAYAVGRRDLEQALAGGRERAVHGVRNGAVQGGRKGVPKGQGDDLTERDRNILEALAERPRSVTWVAERWWAESGRAPTRAQIEGARRRLRALEERGLVAEAGREGREGNRSRLLYATTDAGRRALE